MRSWCLAPILVVLIGCADQHAKFQRLETAYSPQGRPAIRYSMKAPTGDWGVVRVWSRGFEAPAVDPKPARPDQWIHIAFAVENNSTRLLTLDLASTQLHVMRGRAQPLGISVPQYARPTNEAVAGRETEMALYFPLPEGVLPSDVSAYRVVWTLRGLDGMYLQATSFYRDREGPDSASPGEELRVLDPAYAPHGWRPGFGIEDVVGF